MFVERFTEVEEKITILLYSLLYVKNQIKNLQNGFDILKNINIDNVFIYCRCIIQYIYT